MSGFPLPLPPASFLTRNSFAEPGRDLPPPLREYQLRLDALMESFRVSPLGRAPSADEQRAPVGEQGQPMLLDPPAAVQQRIQSARLLFVVGTMVGSLVLTGLSAWQRLGPAAAYVLTAFFALALCCHGLWMRDLLVQRLLVFGSVFGVGALAADYFCVTLTQTLVYPAFGPLLWVSPAYMPMAWMVLMVQFGTVADALMRRLRRLSLVTVLMAVLGGLHIPTFETMANHVGAWSYHNTPLLLGTTPLYIVLAEVLLSAPLPWIVARVKRARGWWQSSSWGVVQAAWTFVALVLAFWLAGR